MFNVNATIFRATALFMSTEETRYYLRGVHIEAHPAGGVLLVATDGHRAFIAHDETGTCDAGPHGNGYIVQLDPAALKALKPERGEVDARRVTGTDEKSPAWITDAAGEQLVLSKNWSVDGAFPDWRRVLPNGEHDSAFHWFNSAYIADFGKAAKILKGDTRFETAISIETGASGKMMQGPATIRMANIPYAFGVLMPLQAKSDEIGIPEFVNRRPAREAAA